MPETVAIEQNGHVRTIILDRPEKKNALSDAFAWSIINAVDDAAKDDDVWVIAITGEGDAFCAGLDLSAERDPYTAPMSAQSAQLDDIGWVGNFSLGFRQRCEKPIVGGINGAAVGAGLALALATDMRIVARSARLMAGYTRIGGSPDGALSWTLPQAIGYEQAMRFMLENRTVLGDEAVELGMAGEVVDDDKLRDRLEEYCQQLAEWSPITTRLTKRAIGKATTHIDLETHVRFERVTVGRAFASEDAQECRRAFFEKRKPVIVGR
jgi:2-(1,2-epoxy-1,2-dihydrophenyl)acetyl-CoA isomerase